MGKKILFFIVCLCIFGGIGYCVYNLYSTYKEYEEIDDMYEELADSYVHISKPDTSNQMVFGINASEPAATEEFVHEDLSYPRIDADIDGLLEVNSDVVGWIYIEDSKVNYPIVKSHDNMDYLKKSVTLKYSRAGSIFMDCANSSDFSDENTIIYGHNMYSGSMFHVLLSYKKQDFYETHKKVYIVDLEGVTHSYHILSARKIMFDAYDYLTRFSPITKSYEDHLIEVVRDSDIDTGYIGDINKPIITLSTCVRHASNERYVLVLQED